MIYNCLFIVLIFLNLLFGVSCADIQETTKDFSDNNALGFIPMVILPNDNIPDYYHLKNQIIGCPRYDVKHSSIFSRLPESLFDYLKSYLDYSDLNNLVLTSSDLEKITSASIERLRIHYKIDLSGLRKRDQCIFLTSSFVKIFFISYPGLISRLINPYDQICLVLLACVVSVKTKFEYTGIKFPDSQAISNLKKAFLSLNIFKNKPLLKSHALDSMFLGINDFSSFLYSIQKIHPTKFTFEAILRLLKLPKVTNTLCNLKQIPLIRISSLGISKDQTFLNNQLNHFSAEELVQYKIGRLHILHSIISTGGNYCAELYERPELSQVTPDPKTQLSFYSATLFYAILHKNYSILKGILGFSNGKFLEFDPVKIDFNYRNLFIEATENGTETSFLNHFLSSEIEILASLK